MLILPYEIILRNGRKAGNLWHHRNKIIRNLLLTLLIVLSNAASSQTLSVDTLTIKPDVPLPFDTDFPFKITINKGIKVSLAYLFEVSNEGCKRTALNSVERQTRIGIVNELLNNQIKIESDLARKQYYQQMKQRVADGVFSKPVQLIRQSGADVRIQMPALKPNTNYRLYLESNAESVEGIEDVLTAIDSNSMDLARTRFDKIKVNYSKSFADEPGCKSNGPDEFHAPDFEMFYLQYNRQLKSLWEDVRSERGKVEAIKPLPALQKFSELYRPQHAATLGRLVTLAEKSGVCQDSLFRLSGLIKNSEGLPTSFGKLQYLSLPIIADGGLSLYGFRNSLPEPNLKGKDRLDNLKKSILTVQAIRSLVDYFALNHPEMHLQLDRLDAYLTVAENVLLTNLKSIETWDKNLSAANAKLAEVEATLNEAIGSFFSLPVAGVGSDTYTVGFVTRAGYRIQSDFGLMVYGNPWHKASPSGLVPYVGFHINLRPVNTEISMSKIPNKDWRNYVSFNAGVLIGSLEEESKQTGLVGKASIFTGLGLNFTHEFRIVFGTVWYRRFDPNPTLNTKKVAATPFAGLSLDLRLENVYKGVKKIFEP